MRNYKPAPIRILTCEECHEQFEAKRSDIKRCRPCAAVREANWRGAYERNRVRQDACPSCGEPKSKNSKQCKSCWARSNSGAGNPMWTGGVTMHHNGYRQVRTNRPGRSNGYELEHRLIWEAANGPIPADHVIHHLNGDKDDNRLENLALLSNRAHRQMHADVDGERSKYIQLLEARIRELEGRT